MYKCQQLLYVVNYIQIFQPYTWRETKIFLPNRNIKSVDIFIYRESITINRHINLMDRINIIIYWGIKILFKYAYVTYCVVQ